MHIYHNIAVYKALRYIRYCRIYAVSVYTDTKLPYKRGK